LIEQAPSLFAVLLWALHQPRQFAYPFKHVSVLHIAFASLKKPNETRNAYDKTTSERTADDLIVHGLIIKLRPLLSRYRRPVKVDVRRIRLAEGGIRHSRQSNSGLRFAHPPYVLHP
jgi:hypothetical protein